MASSSSDSRASGEIGSSKECDYAEILVIRNGETSWDFLGKLEGQLDIIMNDVGKQQAAIVADRLSKEAAICAVYSSDLKRAFETATIIANKCGVSEDPNLRERHLGDAQGIMYNLVPQLRPHAFQALLTERTDVKVPGGGESMDQVFHRCTSSLHSIAMKHIGKRVVVVTHGGPMKQFHRRIDPAKLKKWVPNASIDIFHIYSNNKWVIKSHGDVSHLSNIDFDKTDIGGDETSG